MGGVVLYGVTTPDELGAVGEVAVEDDGDLACELPAFEGVISGVAFQFREVLPVPEEREEGVNAPRQDFAAINGGDRTVREQRIEGLLHEKGREREVDV